MSDENSDKSSNQNDYSEANSFEDEKDNEQLANYISQITAPNFKQFYDQGIQLKNDNKFDESFLIFQALVKKGTQIFGSDIDQNLAMSYFQLGNSLLEKIELSSDIFQAEKNMMIKRVEDKSEMSEEVDSIQVAWENLEFARLIMTNVLDNNDQIQSNEKNVWTSRLANCFLRLGECQVWREQFAPGIADYIKCLELLNQIKESISPRRIAEVHFQIGNGHLYLMAEDSLDQALEHFKSGKKVLVEFINRQKLMKNDNSSIIEELEEVVKNFDLKIEEVNIEIETKEQVNEERKKIQELVSHSGTTNNFVKSEFDENVQPIKKLGRFGKNGMEKKDGGENVGFGNVKLENKGVENEKENGFEGNLCQDLGRDRNVESRGVKRETVYDPEIFERSEKKCRKEFFTEEEKKESKMG